MVLVYFQKNVTGTIYRYVFAMLGFILSDNAKKFGAKILQYSGKKLQPRLTGKTKL
jgi:hypothetical protein